MPDLGTYAVYVLSAYAVTAVVMGALVWLTLRRAARIRARLRKLEASEGQSHV